MRNGLSETTIEYYEAEKAKMTRGQSRALEKILELAIEYNIPVESLRRTRRVGGTILEGVRNGDDAETTVMRSMQLDNGRTTLEEHKHTMVLLVNVMLEEISPDDFHYALDVLISVYNIEKTQEKLSKEN